MKEGYFLGIFTCFALWIIYSFRVELWDEAKILWARARASLAARRARKHLPVDSGSGSSEPTVQQPADEARPLP